MQHSLITEESSESLKHTSLKNNNNGDAADFSKKVIGKVDFSMGVGPTLAVSLDNNQYSLQSYLNETPDASVHRFCSMLKLSESTCQIVKESFLKLVKNDLDAQSNENDSVASLLTDRSSSSSSSSGFGYSEHFDKSSLLHPTSIPTAITPAVASPPTPGGRSSGKVEKNVRLWLSTVVLIIAIFYLIWKS
jgi:hypothetical protein